MQTLWKWLAALHAARLGARARRELRDLPDRMLKDIGLTRADIDSLLR